MAISLNDITQLALIMHTASVYCAVRTDLFLYYFDKFRRQPSPRINFKTFAITQLSPTSLKFRLIAAVQTQNFGQLLIFFPLLQAPDSQLHFSTLYLASSLPLPEGR